MRLSPSCAAAPPTSAQSVYGVNAEARHSTSFPNQDLFQLRTAEESPVALEMATINGARALMWEDVQRQRGHASITTTERQYGHLEKSFLRGAAQRAEARIWGAQSAGEPEPLLSH
jgi:hypothetical protein